ncbi:hypothetical protein [Planctomicrobium piriforme]|uniref:Uncharacterized protein n=1 Tax=Planctomicrobium piriforme TaxID=1576369 RepID=A0A1I3QBF1_9PLAN|nr:hypothetical protein [Planctomicrobium piriforme]SFJ31015.1 hypothetical protein SAMN05421753_11826 [Planctomicrobium piriforme]
MIQVSVKVVCNTCQSRRGPEGLSNRPVLVATLLLFMMLGCSGCGNASARTINHATEGLLESPLPPIVVEPKSLKAKGPVLYGRVVIDGQPAKKGSVVVIAVSVTALQEDPALVMAAIMPPIRMPSPPDSARRKGEEVENVKSVFTSGVLRDDGLYILKGMPLGNYKIACRFTSSFQGKADPMRTAHYADIQGSAIQVNIVEGEVIQDVVMNVAPPAN